MIVSSSEEEEEEWTEFVPLFSGPLPYNMYKINDEVNKMLAVSTIKGGIKVDNKEQDV